MTVLALHPEDILAIAGVILVWVALRRLAGRGRSRRSSASREPTRLDADD
jgi:hypothetical protein